LTDGGVLPAGLKSDSDVHKIWKHGFNIFCC